MLLQLLNTYSSWEHHELDQEPRTTSHGQGHKAECGELWHTWQCKQGVSVTILSTGCAPVNDQRTPEMLEKHDNVID